MLFLFFLSLGIVVYAYIGYPLILAAWAALSGKPVRKAVDHEPKVAVFISAYNEQEIIRARVDNLLSLDYPREKLEIFIGSDGSTDDTYRILKELADKKSIRYAVSFIRRGKPAMLNKMVKDSEAEIFVFADARQTFDRFAVRELVRCFADPRVGAVSGELAIEDQEAGTGKGLGMYWAYEKALRRMESRVGSMLGATGAIYAVRAKSFIFFPEDIILDDVFEPLRMVLAGWRVIVEPGARAYDRMAPTAQREFVRKVRTLAGNFQIFGLLPELFDPRRSPVAFQLFSHKFLRLIVPYFLVLFLMANFFCLVAGRGFLYVFVAQVVFYVLALLGYAMEKADLRVRGALRLLLVPYEFCSLNAAAVSAFERYACGKARATWEKA
ncbi:MAG: glycosyltransferase family 2 protein [Deltaproteobacteria bacterium]